MTVPKDLVQSWLPYRREKVRVHDLKYAVFRTAGLYHARIYAKYLMGGSPYAVLLAGLMRAETMDFPLVRSKC